MSPIEQLVSLFLKFPGVGTRQARRFVYFLLSAPLRYIDEFEHSIAALREKTKQCASCYRFFEHVREKNSECSHCARGRQKILIVVEKDIDLENVRKTGIESSFFVLGSLLSPLQKQSSARTRELHERVKTDVEKNNLQEIVLALRADPHGEYTVSHIKKILLPITDKHGVKITTLGKGVSTGTEIEYSDSETLKHALENRR